MSIPHIPPMFGVPAGLQHVSFFGLSEITASVVRNMAAVDTAFSKATLSTFAGSIIPAVKRFLKSPVFEI